MFQEDELKNRAPGPEWGYSYGKWRVCCETEAFLLASIGPVPDGNTDIVPLRGPTKLSKEDLRKLDSQGIPPDCSDDVSITRARITLDPRTLLSREELNTTGQELTRGYVFRQLEDFLNQLEKQSGEYSNAVCWRM